jgi:hypothetical protein
VGQASWRNRQARGVSAGQRADERGPLVGRQAAERVRTMESLEAQLEVVLKPKLQQAINMEMVTSLNVRMPRRGVRFHDAGGVSPLAERLRRCSSRRLVRHALNTLSPSCPQEFVELYRKLGRTDALLTEYAKARPAQVRSPETWWLVPPSASVPGASSLSLIPSRCHGCP